jgi:hypothetical protein
LLVFEVSKFTWLLTLRVLWLLLGKKRPRKADEEHVGIACYAGREAVVKTRSASYCWPPVPGSPPADSLSLPHTNSLFCLLFLPVDFFLPAVP